MDTAQLNDVLARLADLERRVANIPAITADRGETFRSTMLVRQPAHGFSRYHYVVLQASGTWALATPDLIGAGDTSGMVSQVYGADVFEVTIAGTIEGIPTAGVVHGSDLILSRRSPGGVTDADPWSEFDSSDVSISTDTVRGITTLTPASAAVATAISAQVYQIGRREASGAGGTYRLILTPPKIAWPLVRLLPAGPRPGDTLAMDRSVAMFMGYPLAGTVKAGLGTMVNNPAGFAFPMTLPTGIYPGDSTFYYATMGGAVGTPVTVGVYARQDAVATDFRPASVTVAQVDPLLVRSSDATPWADATGATAYLPAHLLTLTHESAPTPVVGDTFTVAGWTAQNNGSGAQIATLMVRPSGGATYTAGTGITISDNGDGTKSISTTGGGSSGGVTSIAMTPNQGICHPDGTVAAKTGDIVLGFLPFTKKGQIQYCDGNNPVNGTYPQIALDPSIGGQDVTAGAVLTLAAGIPAWTRDVVLGDASNQATLKVHLPGNTTLDLTGTPPATGKTLQFIEIQVCTANGLKKTQVIGTELY